MLARFALLGASYARAVLGVADPSAGLLSIGAEPGKGNRLVREAARRLAELPVRFHGNVEGHDVLAGFVDVVVTDGFTGNVVLKNIEGCVRTTLELVARVHRAAGAAGGGRAAVHRRHSRRRGAARAERDGRGGARLFGRRRDRAGVRGGVRPGRRIATGERPRRADGEVVISALTGGRVPKESGDPCAVVRPGGADEARPVR